MENSENTEVRRQSTYYKVHPLGSQNAGLRPETRNSKLEILNKNCTQQKTEEKNAKQSQFARSEK